MESLINTKGIGEIATASASVINKLLDTISSGLGTIYKPTAIRKEADARAYEIRVISKAESDAEKSYDVAVVNQLTVIAESIVAREIRRKENIDYIAKLASESISNTANISEEPVDQDWATRFINIAQDINDEDMKAMWAKILSSEVAQPNSYSLRTLDALKNLKKTDAQLITKVGQLAFKHHGEPFIYRDNDILAKYGITYNQIQYLVEIGFLNAGNSTIFKYKESDFTILYNNYIVFSENNKKDIDIYTLTTVGKEIYKLIENKTNLDFLKDCLISHKKDTPKAIVTFRVHEIIEETSENIRYKKDPVIKL